MSSKRVLSNGRMFLAWTGAALLCVSDARSAPPPSWGPRVAWTAPDGCPAAATVWAAVDAMAGAPRSPARASDVVASGVVTGEPGRFALEARIETDGLSEAKTVTAESCATLADAYAVIVAFAVDPSAGARLAASASLSLEGGPVVASPPRAVPISQTVATIRAPPRRASGPRSLPPLGIGPFLATAVGLLPLPAYGAGVRASVEAGPRWEIAATYWPERSSSVTVNTGASTTPSGALVGLFTVQPSICAGVWRGAAAVCVGAEIGTMHATGLALPTTHTGVSLWLAPTSSVAVRLPIAGTGAVNLRVRLDLGVPILTPSFVVDQVGLGGSAEVYRPLPVFGMVSVEPELRFFSNGSGR